MKPIVNLKKLAFGFVFIAGLFSAQNITGKSAKVTVSGTSPMHDWSMNSTNGEFNGTVNGNTITNIKFSTAVNQLKSSKGKMMDNKAHMALKSDKNPNVNFAATSVNIGKGNISGKLTIAGFTKDVNFPITVTKNGNNYILNGTETIKLSEFKMDRPGFMGVRTGDEVTINVQINAN